jgi:uncharacterized protein (TIGR03435 family)
MFRLPKWTALVAGAGFGIGLVWLCPPVASRYTASAHVIGTAALDGQLNAWCQAIIRARNPGTGPLSSKLHHPTGDKDNLEIEIATRDRDYSLAVVTDLVDRIRDAGGPSIQVVSPPVVQSEPSFLSLLLGLSVGLLAGAAVHEHLTRGLAILLLSTVASAQSFDVATIKPSAASKGAGDLRATSGTLTIRNLPLQTIIATAFGLADYQVAGPAWLKEERFDLAAKTLAPAADKDDLVPLLQPVLADRFHLAFHRETKELPAFVLVVAKSGPKLEPAADNASGDVPFKKLHKPGAAQIRSGRLTMTQFADLLGRRLGHPVHDSTGLEGSYRISLQWEADTKIAKPGKKPKPGASKDRPSIFTAIQDQLGLRLEARKVPVEILVVDRVDRKPTPN